MLQRVLAIVLFVGLLGGVGGALASPKPLPLRDRLIQKADFKGFKPEAARKTYRSAKAWSASDTNLSASQIAADTARLRHEGFKEVLIELLDRGSETQDGVAWVMQLGSAASARAELAASFAEDEAENKAYGSFSAYTVPGIPGARGYRDAGGGDVGEDILFSDGPFLYLVGEGWQVGEPNPPTRADLVAAVTHLYRRVHGHPAG